MKPSPTFWLGVILLSLFTCGTRVNAQDATTAPTGHQHPRFMQQLGLSEAQKAQIKQIRQSTPKGKERRQEIMAVLTSDQKAQLKQDIEQWKAQH